MSTKKYNSDLLLRYHRQSVRLKSHNYGWSGSYFVTMCAEVREPIFERPALRAILMETWKVLPERFPGLTLDEFVIMPDHVHFIVHLEGNVKKPATLRGVVSAFKSMAVVAWIRHIKANNLELSGLFWHRSYYDRVIRDEEELEQTREYIRNNPLKENGSE